MEKWVVAAKRADFGAIAKKFGIDQVTARLIRNRDIIGDAAIEEYLNGSLLNLHSAHLMNCLLYTSSFAFMTVPPMDRA